MTKIFRIDTGREERPGRDRPTEEAAAESEDAAFETTLSVAKERLGEIVSNPKTSSREAEGKLLLLNNYLTLRPIVEFFESIGQATPSGDVKAAAQRAWVSHNDHELIQAVQMSLNSGQSEWKKYPGRYLELVDEYENRVSQVVDEYGE